MGFSFRNYIQDPASAGPMRQTHGIQPDQSWTQTPQGQEYLSRVGSGEQNVDQSMGVPAPSSGGSSGGRYGYDAQPIFDRYTSQIDYSAPDALDQLEQRMKADGIQVERRGDLFKIPGTEAGFVDILQNKAAVEGRGPVRGWAYQPFYGGEDFDRLVAEGRNPHTGEMALPGQQFSRDQDAPISGPGAQYGGGGLPPGYSMTGTNSLASFNAPGLMAPWTQEFKAPTGTDDPGFQFALDKGLGALDNAASAKGTLLTGGHDKDRVDYATGMALQGYDQAWNRSFDKYGMDRGTFWGNQQNTFGRLNNLADLGLGAASSYAPAQGNLITGQGNANANAGINTANRTNAQWDNVATAAPSIWDSISPAFRRRTAADV